MTTPSSGGFMEWLKRLNTGGGAEGNDLLGNPMFNIGMGLLSAKNDPRQNPYGAAMQGWTGAQNYRTQREEEEEEKRIREARKAASKQIRDLLAPDKMPARELQGPQQGGQPGPMMSQPYEQPSAIAQQLGPFSGIVDSLADSDPVQAAQMAQSRIASPTNPNNIEAMLARTGFWEPESIHAAVNSPTATESGGFDASRLVKIDKLGAKEQTRIGEFTSAAQEAQVNIGKLNYMQDRYMALGSDLQEGWLGKGRAFLRNATGSQEELDDVQRMFSGLRSSTAMANLPPGSASDKDVDLALAPIPSEFADREHLYRYMQGAKKMMVIDQVYNQKRAEFMQANSGKEGNFPAWWSANGDQAIQRAWQMHGMSLNSLGEGAYGNMFPGAAAADGSRGGFADPNNRPMTEAEKERARRLGVDI